MSNGMAMNTGPAFPILVPPRYMPAPVLLGHFFELLLENIMFGVLAELLFEK